MRGGIRLIPPKVPHNDPAIRDRRADLDWLRVGFGLLILYHAGMACRAGRHVTSSDSIEG